MRRAALVGGALVVALVLFASVPPDMHTSHAAAGIEAPHSATSFTAPAERNSPIVAQSAVAAPSSPPTSAAVRRVALEIAPPANLSAVPLSSLNCFHNRVMFQPVTCSKAPDILAKVMELSSALGQNAHQSMWSIVHVGSKDGLLRLGELVDAMGDTSHGAGLVGSLRRAVVPKSACGACCECATSVDLRLVLKDVVPYNATWVFPVDDAEFLTSMETYWGTTRHVVPVERNQFTRCSETLLASILAAVQNVGKPVDVLSLDAWKCDLGVVRAIAAEHAPIAAIRPRLLQFTLVSDTMYEDVMAALARRGYQCYILTTKPEHKKFRGIRTPVYPLAIRLTGCWRGIYDAFKNERFIVSCVPHDDALLSNVFAAFSRMTHKGLQSGCFSPLRGERARKVNGGV